ncbi:hypothetical protein [Staphylococcus simulans]|uniref:hypothetical protein n=1 Tax=Staphylococcus simulans TaxID=1286 RepID=UPI000D1F898B|nr:hypothetical protein [Staphylococcus simulans]PTJ39423.1 hypothetical protein BU024_00010 [Staphylococcus simulans]
MYLILLLVAVIVILAIALVVSRSLMQHRLDTEIYSKNQLVSKVNTLRTEVASLKNQIINDGTQQHHYGVRKAKQSIEKVMQSLKENGEVKFYHIVSTGNVAVKHPLFDFLRTFDYVVITDKGLLNIDVKNWKEKTFYHFSAEPEKPIDTNVEDIDQIIGHYIADQYQSQFQSTREDIYTFTEKVKSNSVTFDFYDCDPYLTASVNSKELKDAYEKNFNQKISSVGLVYFSDGSVNIIDGPTERQKYVETATSKHDLKDAIRNIFMQSKHEITEQDCEKILGYINQP